MLGALALAGLGAALMSNPGRRKRRRNPKFVPVSRNPGRRNPAERVWAIDIKPGKKTLIRAEAIASKVFLSEKGGKPVGWRYRGYHGGIIGGHQLMVYEYRSGLSVLRLYRALRKAKLATCITRRRV